ncbi:MAG TPA: capsule assembly Wzi family protein [Nitrospira sp.]|nr:capsule assembly Wzi family protein [Nitrospira sp.]
MRHWNMLSDAGLAGALGTAGTFYVFGRTTGNPHPRETGLLSAQAAINSLLVSSAVQGITRRARPDSLHGGDFFAGGSSFPSDHAVLSWSIASVVAHEYPGWATKLLAYGTASTVSLSRVGARKHFPSDVLIGSTLGFLIGSETYRRHHDVELPGSNIGDFKPVVEKIPNPMHQGTTYVPLDSWVYPGYDRLAALGYAPSGAQNLRPWTRLEFARLLKEAAVTDPLESEEVKWLYRDLQREFENDSRILDGKSNLGLALDSVYTRIDTISGNPLTDGFHFGQTIVDDYGRPYQRGFNPIFGVATHAEAGPFAFYVRGEYQHTPYAPALPDAVRMDTAAADGLPVAPAAPFNEVNRFRLLESYVALNLTGWQLSFGKQSLWWGPSPAEDLNFSNNAEPITMLRLTRVSPFALPSLMKLLGPIQTDTFLGQLDGYHFLRLGPAFELTGSNEHHIDPQPYVWGYKLTLQPTRNLQVGFSFTSVFAGLGRPLTFDTWFHTLSSRGNAQATEPGDRRTGFDFSYRIPGLRKWLILYSGSVSEDEPNPIAYPRRSAWNPGIYLTGIPRLPRLDLHFESAYTNLPNDPRGAVFYTNTHYANGYTNNGRIMGGWVGPEGRTYLAWANYWLSGKNKMQVGARKQIVDSSYVGGGSLRDLKGSYEFLLRPDVRLHVGAQYERWKFPALANTSRSNFIVSFQVTYQPKWLGLRSHGNQTD